MTVAAKVLVVDDTPHNVKLLADLLTVKGYSVTTAVNGEEALAKVASDFPDLVLLDVMMPRIDGFEVAQRLRKNPQTANTSIIMLTAKALSADKVTGLQSGADDYIIKPFDPIELLARVKGTLRRAKEMRREMTDAECKLWLRLNVRQLGGLKFRKQVPVHPYIADFACLERRLIIELDGGQHDENRAKDEERSRYLEAKGYRVLRF